MIKKAFYWFLGNYMSIVSRIFFSKVELTGRDKVPKGNPIIFSCNHQNAFMDALLIGAFAPIKITSLTRSDVFGNHAGMWFMSAVQMQPIYRMQDGIEKLALNEGVFENVRNRLRDNEGVLIFSEGNHGNEFYLRPLSKGSSRMALESQEKMMDKDIHVVPVGINYFHHQRPLHKLSIVFGDAIRVKDYMEEYNSHAAKGTNNLKNRISDGMKECLLIPEESDDYASRKELINRKNERFRFSDLKDKLENGKGLEKPGKPLRWLRWLSHFIGVLNFLPLLLLAKVFSGVKDIVFYGSLKWISALFIFPLWWILLFGITTGIFGLKVGAVVFGVSFVGLYVRQLLIRWSNPTH